jgi:hypothetical protein
MDVDGLNSVAGPVSFIAARCLEVFFANLICGFNKYQRKYLQTQSKQATIKIYKQNYPDGKDFQRPPTMPTIPVLLQRRKNPENATKYDKKRIYATVRPLASLKFPADANTVLQKWKNEKSV